MKATFEPLKVWDAQAPSDRASHGFVPGVDLSSSLASTEEIRFG